LSAAGGAGYRGAIARFVLIAAVVAGLAVAGSPAWASGAQAHSCAPPRGPGDNLVHSGHVRATRVSCPAARKLMIRCDRFSYGHSGSCAALHRSWHCTSRASGGLGSTEKCTSRGGRIVSWIWLD